MIEVRRTNGWHKRLGMKDVAVLVDDEFSLHGSDPDGILRAPNQWIYDNIKLGNWKSSDTVYQAASALSHFLNWLEDVWADETGDRPDWDLVSEDALVRYFSYQQEEAFSRGIQIPAHAINFRMDRVILFLWWCQQPKQRERGIEHSMDLSDIVTCLDQYDGNDDDHLLAHIGPRQTRQSHRGNPRLKHPFRVNTAKKSVLTYLLNDQDFKVGCQQFNDICFTICAQLFYHCGLRRMEVLEYLTLDSRLNPELTTKRGLIQAGKIDADGHILENFLKYTFIGKGNKQRTVDIPTYLWLSILEHYLPLRRKREKLFIQRMKNNPELAKENGGYSTDVLLLTQNGHLLTRENLSSAFNRAQKAARSLLGRSNFQFRPHMCRHTFATNFIMNYQTTTDKKGREFDVAIHARLQEQMGHTNVSTTEHYIHIVDWLRTEDMLGDYRPSYDTTLAEMIEALSQQRKGA